MINKNKKATTMYEFLVRLVIAVVFVLFAISLAKSLFSFSNEAEDSFYNLISLIEEVSQGKEGLTDSMALVMDKKTSILLFNKDSDYIKYIAVEENFLNKFFGHKGKAELIEKPKNCPEDKSCICLCQGKFEKAAEGYHEIMPILGEGEYTSVTYYYCKKTKVCEGIDQDILVWPQIEQIESISLEDQVDHIFMGGFFIGRNILIHHNDDPRAKAIYVEKYKNIISVCEEPDCITEDMRQQRTGVTTDESKNFLYQKNDMVQFTPWEGRNTYYYITDHKKDTFGIYYYEYDYTAFSNTEQREKYSENFENYFLESVNDYPVLVQHNSDGNVLGFHPNELLTEDGTLSPP